MNVLRISFRVIMSVSVATQLLCIAYYILDFDPRFSCDRLAYGQGWFECMHESSHTYVMMTELAVVCWLVAGIGALLGRFLPAYISIFLPVAVAIGTVWYLVGLLREYIAAHGELYYSDVFLFARTAVILALYIVGPVTGAWLFGVHKRVVRSPTRML
jgi:hypothetical protein